MITRNGKKIAALTIAAGIVFQNISPIMALEGEESVKASDIIISEYVEGSGQNKAIELYNGTGDTIDLSSYSVEVYPTTAITTDKVTQLTGQLEHGKTYIIAYDDSASVVASSADLLSKNLAYNGNDSVVLKKGTTVVDSIGKVGEIPSEAWTSHDKKVSTKDMTLVRKSEISVGDTNVSDNFDPSTEWDAYQKDTFDNLGKHSMDIIMGEDTVSPTIGDITAPTDHNIINDYKLSVKINDDRKVKSASVFYKATGDGEFKELALNYEGDSLYSVTIAKENLSSKGLVLYIQGSDGTNVSKSSEIEVNISEADITAPQLIKLYPSENFNTGSNAKPQIGADYTDKSGVDLASVKLELDGEDITSQATITDEGVKYTPDKDLADGNHTVKLTLNDKASADNKTEKEWSFHVGSEDLNHYFGNIHSHTNYSDGIGTVEEAYNYAKNEANIDFLAVTDHSNSFDNESQASMADGSMSKEWVEGQAAANKHNKEGEFAALFAYEMSWSASTGGYGHMNTFNTPGFESRTNSKMNLKTYYETLKTQPQSISMFNHPGKTFGDFSGFAHYDEEIDKLITLVEVGNGDGAVGSNGYFPSYDEFVKALDKGWHIAPTNGQDNHKGKWGDANTTRTVILSNSLSREAVYQAMRDRRVYSTEDENLELDFKINGNVMGTILDETENLTFDIEVNDPDASEKSATVEIVANGGKVVKSMKMNSNTQAFNFDMPSDYSYYFVKVTQADGQIAVSAPIWVGEVVSVGINSVTTDKDIVIKDEEVTINTEVYNNESVSAENVKVEYFLGNESKANKIGEVDLKAVAATTTVKAPLKYTATKEGKFDIISKVTMTINGIEMSMSEKVSITVKDSAYLSKIVLEGSKQNYYVSGDYADSTNELVKLAATNNAQVIVNKEKLTSETLKGASLLIISDPQSKANTSKGLTPQAYDKEELKVIADFVANGGSVVVTSRADYGDSAEEIYENSVQGNAVLEAIGSTLRFNDDQIVDNENYSNQTYRLYFNKYDENSSLLKGLDKEKTFSFYSGCGVLINPSSKASALVKGHDTTESTDADKSGDNTSVEKGNVVGLASETLPGGGTVIVGGTTFFSDYELKEDAAAKYSNADIMKNIVKNLAPKPQRPITTIAEVRKDEDNDNVADNYGQTFAIEGTVTVASNAAAPVNSFFDCMYVQDETGGITIFGVSESNIKEGQRVRIEGVVDDYLGDTELALDDEFVDITVLDENINKVEPKVLSTKDSMLESNEGLLVKVQGEVVKIEGQNIFVNDGSGIARAYVEGYIGSSSKGALESGENAWASRIAIGDIVSIVGMSSEDGEEFAKRLRVRDTDEIVKKVADNSQKPGDSEDNNQGGSGNGSGTGGSQGNDGSGSGNGSGTGGSQGNNKPNQSPSTGDAGIGTMLMSAIGATGILGFLSKRKKSNK